MANPKKPSDYLDECAAAISYCDTNGNLLLDTLENKVELKTLEQWFNAHPEMNHAVNHLFQTIGIHSDTEKENFLLTLGSSLRMFPEVNFLRSGANHLTRYEIAELVHHLDAARITNESKLPLVSYARYLDIFLNTIELSLQFAESQKFATFAEMAELVHAPALFNHVLTNGWEYYAEKLPQFKQYWESLPSTEKEQIATTLFTLAAKQEGVRLNQQNTEIQKLVTAQSSHAPSAASLFRETEAKIPEQPAPTPRSKKNL